MLFLRVFVAAALLCGVVAAVDDATILERDHGDGFDAYPISSFVVANARVTLFCNRTNDSSFHAVWLHRDRDGTAQSERIVSRAFPDHEFNASAQSLTIRRFGSTYEGLYGCATSCGGPMRDGGFASLRLAAPPDVTSFNMPTVNMSDSVTIRCTPTALPPPTRVSLWREGVEIAHGATNVTHTIASTMRGDSGAYTCVAVNEAGTRNQTDNLVVQYAPEFRSAGHVNLFYVKRGGSIRFSCSFDGVPRPLVEWYFDGMKIGESYSSDFNVTDADRKDGGVYWCKGRNSLGKTDGVNMTLRVRVPPDPPTIDTHNVEKTNSSLTLTWDKGHDGFSDVIGYSIHYKESAKSKWLPILLNSSVETMYTLTGLKAFTDYDVKVAARNEMGIGTYSTSFTEKTYPNKLSVGPTDLKCENLTSTSVDLRWKPVDVSRLSADEGSVLFYEAVFEIDGEVVMELTSPRQNYMRANISDGPLYTVTVYACNSVGCSPPSNSVTFSSGNEWWIIAVSAGGGGGGLVALIIIIVLIVWRCRKGSKQKSGTP